MPAHLHLRQVQVRVHLWQVHHRAEGPSGRDMTEPGPIGYARPDDEPGHGRSVAVMNFSYTGMAQAPDGRNRDAWRVARRPDGSLVVAVCTAWGTWFELDAEEQAARTIVEQLAETAETPATEAIGDAMSRVNRDFLAVRPEVIEDAGPTCCAVVAVLAPDRTCTVAWVGSAMAVHRAAGGAVRATRPHLLRDVMVEKGVPREQVEGHPNGLIVVRALGATSPLDLEFAHWSDIHPGDRILLASQAVAEAFEGQDAGSLEDIFAAADRLHAENRHPRYRDRVAVLIDIAA